MISRNIASPNRITSFNCQSRHLFTSKLHSIPPPSYRAVILAEGFFEWQPRYPGDRLFSQLSPQKQAKPPKSIAKQRFLIHKPGDVLYMAAMCKHWVTPSGEPLVSAGSITLPPHPAFLDIHAKSFPLLLNKSELDNWLDPKIPLEAFKDLFEITSFRQALEAVAVNEPISYPSRLQPR